MNKLFAFTGLIFLISSCDSNMNSFSPAQQSMVKDNVQQMAASISKNVSEKGPVEWLHYFENCPGFFMAVDGQLVFPDNDSATNFIKYVLPKSISKIELRWSNIRIDPITPELAGFAAEFHEDITDPNGKSMPSDGYFTAIAQQTSDGWKLRNAHWSTKQVTPH